MQKGPDNEGKQCKEQDHSGGDEQVITQPDGQEVIQYMQIVPFHADGGTKAGTAVPPDHGGVAERKQEPHDTHEGHAGEAHIGGDHHLTTLYLIQQLPVSPTEDYCEGSRKEYCE
ncbi:hypothetical protein SDC9_114629 [bioreactor metagenome]|uniref:Uncharacterized protein n=1 Tax=bioreactor metagenome TaxID=1076179 RepID=A0A645BQY3_9ZZZZ